MQKVRPFLWFDDNAEEAAKFYTSIFKNSKIEHVSPMMVIFQIDGQPVMALNGGPQFTLTEAFSFFVNCETQAEVDELWTKLSAGGEPGRCGWLKDKFGLSWQIVPTILGELMSDEDDKKSEAVMNAMLKMNKLDIAGLKRAYEEARSS